MTAAVEQTVGKPEGAPAAVEASQVTDSVDLAAIADPAVATVPTDPATPYHVPHHEHRDVSGGWLRPAVFGAMDGLVSNLALMTGVAGGAVSTRTIVVTGLAGLAAGAFSMAAGEYTSVASQRELVEAELAVERIELRRHPEDELRELTELYVSRGVEPELAYEVARQLSVDPEQALEIHAREELGVDPTDLPSP
ncbi:MAG: vacuolar iron transporter family protein, partial [Streptomyces sp.]|nr:vacuolar iron transporter family protein [Streptomyces sp.]